MEGHLKSACLGFGRRGALNLPAPKYPEQCTGQANFNRFVERGAIELCLPRGILNKCIGHANFGEFQDGGAT